jgi:hydroxymethylbilane synthase
MKQSPYSAIGSKGVFAVELQQALLRGEIDVAVHSLKDLAASEPEGLEVAAFLERGEVRDVLVGRSLDDLPSGSSVGTSALRRAEQLRTMRADLEIVPLRGNVDTRLEKVARGEVDAAVLAGAGLERLGRLDAVREWLDPRTFLPAPGQGAIALETRVERAETVRHADHEATRAAVTAERAFTRAMEGGCDVPLGAWARVERGVVVIDGWLVHPDGRAVRGRHEHGDPEQAGLGLAQLLR